MPEVDYSQFLYKRPVPPPYDDKPKHSASRREPTKKGKRAIRVFLVVLCILLCFGVTLFLADFFSGGTLVKNVYALMVRPRYTYYLVACSFPTREMAHAGVLAAENAGGAGYLLAEETYLVFYDAYFDKPSAETVAARNDAFFVYEVSYASSDTELAGAVDGFLREVSACLTGLDGGTVGESALTGALDSQRILFSSLSRDDEQKAALVSYVLRCIDDLRPGTTGRGELLFKTRHALVSVLFAARDVFA